MVGLLVERLARLADSDRRALAVASVIGSRFTVGELASLLQVDEETARERVEAAIAEGLLLAPGDGSFRFLHDRVQQAASQSLGADEDAKLRLALGRAVLAQTAEPEHSNRLLRPKGNRKLNRRR